MIEEDLCSDNFLRQVSEIESLQPELNAVKKLFELEKTRIQQAAIKEEQGIIRKELMEQYVGKTLILEVQKDELDEPVFRIDNKYIGKIVVNKANYPGISRDSIANILNQVATGQYLSCKVQEIFPDFSFGLRWMIEEDLTADELLGKVSETKKVTSSNVLKKKKRVTEKYIQTTHCSLRIGVGLTGKIVQAKIINIEGNEPCCLTTGGNKGYLPVASHLYQGISRQIMKKKFRQLFEENTLITCQITGVRPDNYLLLRWLIESDPVAKKYF
jgi:hypothetical protein